MNSLTIHNIFLLAEEGLMLACPFVFYSVRTCRHDEFLVINGAEVK